MRRTETKVIWKTTKTGDHTSTQVFKREERVSTQTRNAEGWESRHAEGRTRHAEGRESRHAEGREHVQVADNRHEEAREHAGRCQREECRPGCDELGSGEGAFENGTGREQARGKAV